MAKNENVIRKTDDIHNAVYHLREESEKQFIEQKQGSFDPLTESKIKNLNEALDRFDKDIKHYQKDLTLKQRPQLFSENENNVDNKEYTKAFVKYIRKGDATGLTSMDQSPSNTTSNIDSAAGFLVSSSISDIINQTLMSKSIMRQLASSITVSTSIFDAINYNSEIDAVWSGSANNIAQTSDSFTKKQISVHELTAQPKVTQQIIDDVAIDVEQWIGNKLADIFLEKENDAFLNGDGIDMPKGILSSENIERVASGDSDGLTVDGIMNLYYSLSDRYNGNGSFVMHKSTVHQIRTMKDANGQYIWMPGLLSGKSDTLLGAPLYTSGNMPTISLDSNVAIYGDFSKAYQIVDRDGVRVQRDPFTNKPFVIFYTTKRVGGDVVDKNALKVLKISA